MEERVARSWLLSLAKFLLTGIIVAAAFWLIARFGGIYSVSAILQ